MKTVLEWIIKHGGTLTIKRCEIKYIRIHYERDCRGFQFDTRPDLYNEMESYILLRLEETLE